MNCTFKVDEYGFFIYWKSEGRVSVCLRTKTWRIDRKKTKSACLFYLQEGDVIELCQVSDIRAGGLPKDMKLTNQLFNRHGETLEDKSLTICSGTDYININYQHVICPSAELAKVRICLLFFFLLRFFSLSLLILS